LGWGFFIATQQLFRRLSLQGNSYYSWRLLSEYETYKNA